MGDGRKRCCSINAIKGAKVVVSAVGIEPTTYWLRVMFPEVATALTTAAVTIT